MAQHTVPLNGAHLTWLGHATFQIISPQGKILLIDPWTQGNPACPQNLKRVDKVDVMLITHGHFDHIGDAISIATATTPTVVAIVELASWLQSKGVQNAIGMNKGGTTTVQDIQVSMTHAIHTSGVDGDTSYVGEACGYVIQLENGLKLYHAGDTCAFTDMQLIGELYQPDVAMLPIGDFYTMDPRGAALAVRMLGVKHVIPMHYATFPILTGRPEQLREALQTLGLTEVQVVEMTPGQTIR